MLMCSKNYSDSNHHENGGPGIFNLSHMGYRKDQQKDCIVVMGGSATCGRGLLRDLLKQKQFKGTIVNMSRSRIDEFDAFEKTRRFVHVPFDILKPFNEPNEEYLYRASTIIVISGKPSFSRYRDQGNGYGTLECWNEGMDRVFHFAGHQGIRVIFYGSTTMHICGHFMWGGDYGLHKKHVRNSIRKFNTTYPNAAYMYYDIPYVIDYRSACNSSLLIDACIEDGFKPTVEPMEFYYCTMRMLHDITIQDVFDDSHWCECKSLTMKDKVSIYDLEPKLNFLPSSNRANLYWPPQEGLNLLGENITTDVEEHVDFHEDSLALAREHTKVTKDFFGEKWSLMLKSRVKWFARNVTKSKL